MKVKKKFMYGDIELRIVEREEIYRGGAWKAIRVLAPNGGVVPIPEIRHKQTLKSIVEETIKSLDNFKKMGADVKAELTKEI